MNNTIVTVGTVTYAIKAKKLLSKIGIRSKLVKLDSQKTQNGCVYGIELEQRYMFDAVSMLRENGIQYSGY